MSEAVPNLEGLLREALAPVEPPEDLDRTTETRHGSDFQNLHRNKRSLALNLKAPGALEVLMRLVDTADVLGQGALAGDEGGGGDGGGEDQAEGGLEEDAAPARVLPGSGHGGIS